MDKNKKWFFGIATAANIFKTVLATLAALLFCGWMFKVIGDEPGGMIPKVIIVVFLMIFIFGFGAVTFGWDKLLKTNKAKRQLHTELESDLDTTYIQPLDRAVIEVNEKVLAWYGPMGRNDMAGTGAQVGLKENISGENTLLITNRQVICMMVGPADTKNIDKAEHSSAVSTAIEAVPTGEGVSNRKQQFESLWFNQWGKIISELIAPEQLTQMLAAHRNYGIPFDLIKEVNIKHRFFNPGVHVTLKNGVTFKYAGFDKRNLDVVQTALANNVTTKSSSIL